MIEREVPPPTDPRGRWANARRGGRRSYIIRVGILRFGLIFAAVTVLAKLFFVWRGAELDLVTELVRLVIGTVVFGAVMGWWTWRTMERRFGSVAHAGEADASGTQTI